MEIPLQAQVECTDGVCGQSEFVLINPVSEQVTHVVVKMAARPHTEYIVPVGVVVSTVAGVLQLSCTKAALEQMDPFITTEFIEETVPDREFAMGTMGGGMPYTPGSYYYYPYVGHTYTVHVPVDHREIPLGELAIRRGAHVEATAGPVGRVDEFVINAANGSITHLVMREGHLWGQRDVIIPVSALGEIRDDVVHLKLNKHQIEALPSFPLHRRWS